MVLDRSPPLPPPADEGWRFWYGLINYEQRAPTPADLKLDRMRSLLARLGGECVSDGAFASARRSGNAHAVSSIEGRGNTSHNLWDLCTVPFNVRHELRQGPLVTSKHSLNEIHGG